MRDKVGNELHEGAILRVDHFVGSRNKKYYMYKQVGERHPNGRLKIYHLPKTNNGFYTVSNQEHLTDSLVVQCNCEYHIRNDLRSRA